MDNSFYTRLQPFTDFAAVMDERHYYSVPKDWCIVLTDIRGSTQAIKNGRYKQVNLIGAASIICVLNKLEPGSVPFVFGGDGASLLVHKNSIEKALVPLRALQATAQKYFGLELRVGWIEISQLRAPLSVAKYQLSPGNYLAQFRGGALAEAESLIKQSHPGAHLIHPSQSEPPPDLTGLSCRLEPLKSKRGQILTMICKPRDPNSKILETLLLNIQSIFGADLKQASPVTIDRLQWNWVPESFRDEVRLIEKSGTWGWRGLKRLFAILTANFSLKLNVRLGPFSPAKYKLEFLSNSDFHKFDEILRMVVDGTEEQIQKLEKLLKDHSKEIYFGIHKSSDALITCMVFSPINNQHLHFIDGAQGGYAFAARQLKSQIAATPGAI